MRGPAQADSRQGAATLASQVLCGTCVPPQGPPGRCTHLHGQRFSVLRELFEDGIRILNALLVLLGLLGGSASRRTLYT